MTSFLEVTDLAKAYNGVPAVRGVSFALEPGSMLALIGPNGAGKTTCFNMLNGQIRPDAGTIRLAGEDVTGLSPKVMWRRGVGRTFQITATFASMSVRENVETALRAHAGSSFRPWPTQSAKLRLEAGALLDRVGLAPQAERACAELAYGDLKRLELALALTNAPKLLLMDEPTAGMAPRERASLMRSVAAIAKEQGVGVLFTEHDMDVVFEHADRVLVLARGALIAQGTPDAVRLDPEVRAIYLGTGLAHGDLAAARA